jgi:RNA polymerase sigma-70 factor (ECF subfamily)
MDLWPDFTSILGGAKSGADWAWATIYRELVGPVTGYLAARGAEDPDDLASETFLQVARDIASFQGDESGFRSWLFTIAHHRLLDSKRAAGRRPRPSTLIDPKSEQEGGNTEEEALERISTSEVLSALERLTQDQRTVIALRIIGDLSLEQTAQVLGRRPGAVKALQHRAVLALQREIEDKG